MVRTEVVTASFLRSFFPYSSSVRFPSLDEAVAHLAPRYHADTRAQKSRLREFLSRVLSKDGDEWILYHRAEGVKVWWQVSGFTPPAGS